MLSVSFYSFQHQLIAYHPLDPIRPAQGFRSKRCSGLRTFRQSVLAQSPVYMVESVLPKEGFATEYAQRHTTVPGCLEHHLVLLPDSIVLCGVLLNIFDDRIVVEANAIDGTLDICWPEV